MKFSIDQSKLDQALKMCSVRPVVTRPSLPVLNNVHIKTEADSVVFTSY